MEEDIAAAAAAASVSAVEEGDAGERHKDGGRQAQVIASAVFVEPVPVPDEFCEAMCERVTSSIAPETDADAKSKSSGDDSEGEGGDDADSGAGDGGQRPLKAAATDAPLVDAALVKMALAHQHAEVRANMLAFLCECKKTRTIPTSFELRAVQFFLLWNKLASTAERKSVDRCVRRLLARIHTVFGSSKYKAATVNDADTAAVATASRSFVKWLWTFSFHLLGAFSWRWQTETSRERSRETRGHADTRTHRHTDTHTDTHTHTQTHTNTHRHRHTHQHTQHLQVRTSHFKRAHWGRRCWSKFRPAFHQPLCAAFSRGHRTACRPLLLLKTDTIQTGLCFRSREQKSAA